MTQASTPPPPATPGKGKAFFDRADQVADTGNWEMAIEYYVEGIRREPDNVERGYKPLREVSLQRKLKGGKPPGMMETMKLGPAKDPVVSLGNAAYLLAKDPPSEKYMEALLKAAQTGNFTAAIKWICDTIFDGQKKAARRNKRLLQIITSAYDQLEEYASGVTVCQMIYEMEPTAPNQKNLQEMLTKETIKRSRLGDEADFTKGVKDMAKQKDLLESDKVASSTDYIKQQVAKTREEYVANDRVPSKINEYVNWLTKAEDEGYENEAIDVLNKAHRDLGAYQFKMKIGDIRMRQMSRRFRKFRDEGNTAAAKEALKAQLDFELQEWTERSQNYPTDLAIKFELGRRQLAAGRLDDAIASLQQAQRDPRRQVAAMIFLGQAFAKKGWFNEASETLERTLAIDMPEEKRKEVCYALGDVYDQMNELSKAQDQFSRAAQIDYNFKDVRTRLEDIRKRMTGGGGK